MVYDNDPRVYLAGMDTPLTPDRCTILDNGWVAVFWSDGTSDKIPPHRVKKVRTLTDE